MADSIHKLTEKLQQLQSEVVDIGIRKSVGKEELKDLHNEIQPTQEKLTLVNKTFNIKYEELQEACSQAQDYKIMLSNSKIAKTIKNLNA